MDTETGSGQVEQPDALTAADIHLDLAKTLMVQWADMDAENPAFVHTAPIALQVAHVQATIALTEQVKRVADHLESEREFQMALSRMENDC